MLTDFVSHPQFCSRLVTQDRFQLFRVRQSAQKRLDWELLGVVALRTGAFTPESEVNANDEMRAAVATFTQMLIQISKDNPLVFATLLSLGSTAAQISKLDSMLTRDEFETLIWAEADLRHAITLNKGLELMPRDDAEGHIIKGNRLMAEGNAEAAEASFREAVTLNGSAHNARNFLAVSLFKQGQVDEAVVEMRQAIRLRPGNFGYGLRMINFLIEAGQESEARVEIHEMMKQAATMSESQRVQLSRFAQRINDIDTAYLLVNGALNGDGLPQAELEHAITISLKKGGEVLAFEVIRNNPPSEPMSANLRQWSIRRMITDGALVDARETAKVWLASEPESAQAMFLLGRIYKEMKRPKRAIHYLETAIKLNDRHAPSYKLLSDLSLESGQLKQAELYARKAAEYDPQNTNIRNLLKTISDKREKQGSTDAG